MPDHLPAGPYRTLRLSDGTEVPYYIVPFDEDGRCTAPQARQHLVERAGGFSDLFLFSHGWNNDWTVATKRYESFITGFMAQRQEQGIPLPPNYRPVLVGVFWPSAVLVRDEEEGPVIAAGGPTAATDAAVAEERAALRDIAARLPRDSVERFYDLSQRETLTRDDALELARILRPIYAEGDSELSTAGPTPEEMVAAWVAMSPAPAPADPDDFGTAGGTTGGPHAAGVFGSLANLGRNAIRGTTVWVMKDRAGTVGARGVGPLLVDLLAAGQARVHMIGHSYGGKVVLSALCAPPSLPRRVHAMLLLQPAVSHLCFADSVPLKNVPGGYRRALERVERAIFTTFSTHDVPLTTVFHLALVRPSDLGEMKIAAAGEPPTWFAALGGFGPRRAGERLVDMVVPPAAYALDGTTRIYGLRGDATISGHGDISNPATWWALHALVRG
jgi:hypothetical protein